MTKQAEDTKTADLAGHVYAYLRVSTDEQDVTKQRHGIDEYAKGLGLAAPIYIEDSASGTIKWQARRLGALIQDSRAGDTLIFAEIPRIGRSTLQVLEVLKECAERSVNVHIAKQRLVVDSSLGSKIIVTMLGLAGEIEREMISQRTSEALRKLKADGVKLGRPEGPAKRTKLDEREAEIRGYLTKQISKRNIAKLVDCSPSTLYAWMNRKGIAL